MPGKNFTQAIEAGKKVLKDMKAGRSKGPAVSLVQAAMKQGVPLDTDMAKNVDLGKVTGLEAKPARVAARADGNTGTALDPSVTTPEVITGGIPTAGLQNPVTPPKPIKTA